MGAFYFVNDQNCEGARKVKEGIGWILGFLCGALFVLIIQGLAQ